MRVVIPFVAVALSSFGMSLHVAQDPPGPGTVGSVVGLNATVSGRPSDTIWYRFRVKDPLSDRFRTVREFGPDASMIWLAGLEEGTYQIEIAAKDRATGEVVSQTLSYPITAAVTGDQPLLTGTIHALVYRYSAPPCAPGSRMRVQFFERGTTRQFTPFRDCREGATMNFYLAGLRAGGEYTVRHVVQTRDQFTEGPAMTLSVPPLELSLAKTLALLKPEGRIREGLLLQATLNQMPVVTDMDGNIVWYYAAPVSYLTRPEPGGYFFVLYEDHDGQPYQQVLRLVDVMGQTVLETNAAAVNEQLVSLGKRPITSFHHEARILPDGKILVLAATEQIMENVQGAGPVDIIGDMILVLDTDMKVRWTWDGFDHLDINRRAILNETCTPGGGGCPTFYLAPRANDWLHGNSLQLTPDGHLLYSIRHQDWVIKIDFAHGSGSGNVIWRLGKDGDFRWESDEPWPWFSHQHDANYERSPGMNRVVVFDNGNSRRVSDAKANSRGQVIELDEVNRTAKLVLNVDLGAYSRALGSAQRLSNGNYHFNLGWSPTDGSEALEYDPSGKLVTQIEIGTQHYRSFRMRDLYTP